MNTAPTDRTRVQRRAERGVYDPEQIHSILDEGYICHVGFVEGGQPYVIPTAYGRAGDRIYLHGSVVSRMMASLAEGIPVCVTVTLVDGLVLARSAFHHSINYRSVVVLGRARPVTDPAEKLAALRCITNHIVPGRWEEVREPDQQELAATQVLALPLDEASAKARAGPPVDADGDYALPVWAGVVPLRTLAGDPIPDERLQPGAPAMDTRRWTRFLRSGDPA
jgi:nitroimidazol reductase NimA-like FMN-containing flavoprotein (pyridoxamine 5'-phosphate oxidase superfamily)